MEREKDQLRADHRSLRRTVHIFFWSVVTLQILELAALMVIATIK